uniref:Synaptopodin 2-like protein n=1 Tax=Latimeria chalumnae TaxID=7897 RepID=H3A8F8_LATCH
VGEQVLISLSGGPPWGFRLQGGSEQNKPLQVAKIRKRSKAWRAGMRENDEFMSINRSPCAGLSHAEAMQMMDSSTGIVQIQSRVTFAGCFSPTFENISSAPLRVLSPSKLNQQEFEIRHFAASPIGAVIRSPEPLSEGKYRLKVETLASPSDSEAYYGETDSDADTVHEKQRRTKRRSPRSSPGQSHKAYNKKSTEEVSEMSGYDSAPEPPHYVRPEAQVPLHSGISDQNMKDTPGISEKDSGFQEEPIPRSSPKIVLLVSKHLIPMVGPVDNPVDEELTMTYKEKAKQAKLHRSESVQEKQVKEARTKCKTIASLLTDAPNPHSKGVLMFKKRRQRAKKYTLVSYGSVDEDRYNEEEDGVFPTSESEFDEEGFSDARSLTNHSAHSDWDNTYLDIEKPKDVPQQEQGLNEASGKGAALFEQQRRRSGEYVVEEVPAQKEKTQQVSSPSVSKAYSEVVNPTTMNVNSDFIPSVAIQHQPPEPCGESTMFSTGVVNRTARPFTPGFVGSRTVTTPVIFRPCVPKAHTETPNVQNTVAKPFSPTTPVAPKPVFSSISQPVNLESKQLNPQPLIAVKSPESRQMTQIFSPPVTPVTPTALTHTSSLPEQSSSTVNFPVHPVTSPISPINQPSETLVSREQRIAVPAARTGILHEARRRGSKKQMFTVAEQKKNSPNPELLSLVQNLDEKPKQDHYGAGCESGPEEDFLSLGAEACNFLPSQAHKQKTPPPVAPKPQLRLLNGNPAPDISHLKGKGAELFAKRQSRMDKFIVDAVPVQADKPRCPSPAPSLPASWKYSPNIRAPPPIAYNPIYSPSYPPGAVKSQASKTSTGVKKVSSQKKGITAIDFMRRQPYQLNPAMFCFSGSANQSLPTTRQVPLKAARVYEVKRFSTPVPMSTPTTLTPTVITPRSATTLAEPVWRTEICSPPPAFTPPAPMPKPVAPKQTVGSLHVPRPRFSAANIGMQANVWRPASVKH